ncbi:MAG: carbohydrate kinase [Synergistaceae bacterium]|jgi:fructokinase|nr:carbohydrate kinase [Synergistaceae bacterium]
MKHVLCSGEILYDFLSTTPGAGLAKSKFFERRPGGSPFNTAVGVARLGHKTGFLVKLGTDEFGLELKSLLLNEGLDSRYLLEGKGQNTTLAMAAIDTEGKAQFRFYRDHAADISLTWDELPPIDPAEVALYHFGSVSLGDPPASETYVRLFKTMKSAGVVTVLDPNIRPLYLKDKPSFKPRLLEWISEVDVLKLSDDDLTWITGKNDTTKGLDALPANESGLLIVTEGSKGARARWHKQEISIPGFKVEVNETTGCGDAFMAGVMYKLMPLADTRLAKLDMPQLADILRFSNACAAIVATRRGAANSMPRLEEVEFFLKAQG